MPIFKTAKFRITPDFKPPAGAVSFIQGSGIRILLSAHLGMRFERYIFLKESLLKNGNIYILHYFAFVYFLEVVVKGPSTKGSTYGLKSFHRLIEDKWWKPTPFHEKKMKEDDKIHQTNNFFRHHHQPTFSQHWQTGHIVILTQFCSILYLLMSIWVNIWIISAVRTKFCPRIYMREWEEVTKNWVTHFFIWP